MPSPSLHPRVGRPIRARQDLNLRPLAPEASALSTELRAPAVASRSPRHADRRHLRHPPAARRAAAPRALRRADRGADLLLHAGDFAERRGAARARVDRAAAGGVHGQRGQRASCGGCCRPSASSRRAARGSRWCTTPGRARAGSSACGARFGDAPTPWCSATRTIPLHERAATASRSSTPAARRSAAARPRHTMGLARVEGRAGRASSWSPLGLASDSAAMDLDVLFVGTAGSAPTARRGLPATLVRRGGDRLLFDCGEGTQRQLVRSIGLVELEEVFLTHFHADHVLGLPGMLKTFGLRQRERPLTVYGPRGLRALVRAAAARGRAPDLRARAGRARAATTSSSATATGSPPTRWTTCPGARLRAGGGRAARATSTPSARERAGGRRPARTSAASSAARR